MSKRRVPTPVACVWGVVPNQARVRFDMLRTGCQHDLEYTGPQWHLVLPIEHSLAHARDTVR